MPTGESRGVIVIAHGFKGYKDYGMLPRIARECSARGGLTAHRFNFSHSGMTDNLATFERPDLFERDTWSKQVFDLTAVLRAIARGELVGRGLPMFMLGHSRGGVTAILTAARFTYPAARPIAGEPNLDLAGVITLAAPSSCNPFTHQEQEQLLKHGWLDSPSSRTGQRLRVGAAFLQEQIDDPAAHDVLSNLKRLASPILIIHGRDDPTVPADCAEALAAAARGPASLFVINAADHVFNTPNPLPDSQPSSLQLTQAIDAIVAFTSNIVGVHRS